MGKVIRLSESDLVRLTGKILNEQESEGFGLLKSKGKSNSLKSTPPKKQLPSIPKEESEIEDVLKFYFNKKDTISSYT